MNASDVTPISAARARKQAANDLTLDALAAMTVDELGARYARGTVPDSLAVLDGSPTGRMLAVAGTGTGVVAGALRRFASARAFPWGGKSFAASTDERGRGINRVHLGGRHLLFPFETDFAPSRIDDQPAIRLDYDLDDNPGLIRHIHDEIREVTPGLFLGPAMWRHGAEVTFVLWFALDTRVQATPVRWG